MEAQHTSPTNSTNLFPSTFSTATTTYRTPLSQKIKNTANRTMVFPWPKGAKPAEDEEPSLQESSAESAESIIEEEHLIPESSTAVPESSWRDLFQNKMAMAESLQAMAETRRQKKLRKLIWGVEYEDEVSVERKPSLTSSLRSSNDGTAGDRMTVFWRNTVMPRAMGSVAAYGEFVIPPLPNSEVPASGSARMLGAPGGQGRIMVRGVEDEEVEGDELDGDGLVDEDVKPEQDKLLAKSHERSLFEHEDTRHGCSEPEELELLPESRAQSLTDHEGSEHDEVAHLTVSREPSHIASEEVEAEQTEDAAYNEEDFVIPVKNSRRFAMRFETHTREEDLLERIMAAKNPEVAVTIEEVIEPLVRVQTPSLEPDFREHITTAEEPKPDTVRRSNEPEVRVQTQTREQVLTPISVPKEPEPIVEVKKVSAPAAQFQVSIGSGSGEHSMAAKEPGVPAVPLRNQNRVPRFAEHEMAAKKPELAIEDRNPSAPGARFQAHPQSGFRDNSTAAKGPAPAVEVKEPSAPALRFQNQTQSGFGEHNTAAKEPESAVEYRKPSVLAKNHARPGFGEHSMAALKPEPLVIVKKPSGPQTRPRFEDHSTGANAPEPVNEARKPAVPGARFQDQTWVPEAGNNRMAAEKQDIAIHPKQPEPAIEVKKPNGPATRFQTQAQEAELESGNRSVEAKAPEVAIQLKTPEPAIEPKNSNGLATRIQTQPQQSDSGNRSMTPEAPKAAIQPKKPEPETEPPRPTVPARRFQTPPQETESGNNSMAPKAPQAAIQPKKPDPAIEPPRPTVPATRFQTPPQEIESATSSTAPKTPAPVLIGARKVAARFEAQTQTRDSNADKPSTEPPVGGGRKASGLAVRFETQARNGLPPKYGPGRDIGSMLPKERNSAVMAVRNASGKSVKERIASMEKRRLEGNP